VAALHLEQIRVKGDELILGAQGFVQDGKQRAGKHAPKMLYFIDIS